MDPILLIAPVLSEVWPLPPSLHLSSLLVSLPSSPTLSARAQERARDKARATHQARDPRYVEISADLSSKLDRVLPSWGPSRVLFPCWRPPTPIENNGSQPFFSHRKWLTRRYDYD